MATLRFNETDYVVSHAVKGTDYIHGYNADNVCTVAIEGITDFSVIEYDGEYMAPEACLPEKCNEVLYVNGTLMRRDRTPIDVGRVQVVTLTAIEGTSNYTASHSAAQIKTLVANNYSVVLVHDGMIFQPYEMPSDSDDSARFIFTRWSADSVLLLGYTITGQTAKSTSNTIKIPKTPIQDRTDRLNPNDVFIAVRAGTPIVVEHRDSSHGPIMFTAFTAFEEGRTVSASAIWYFRDKLELLTLLGNATTGTWELLSTNNANGVSF